MEVLEVLENMEMLVQNQNRPPVAHLLYWFSVDAKNRNRVGPVVYEIWRVQTTGQTDGRTDRRTNGQAETYIAPLHVTSLAINRRKTGICYQFYLLLNKYLSTNINKSKNH